MRDSWPAEDDPRRCVLRAVQAPGCINDIAVGKRFLALAVGKAALFVRCDCWGVGVSRFLSFFPFAYIYTYIYIYIHTHTFIYIYKHI